ncbi:alpha/beta hydrolase [Rhodococcus opacus]|uniref:alpha/beta fold hydrolase n=1 Tax=Rhodococcus opacus TaxID=37919 RepID=UPI001FF10243|nr:alpha/beta hydrolase [Rhodococcus opacus]UOT01593.1 alpha/beta hydrolase [Rhodococcus opacus]
MKRIPVATHGIYRERGASVPVRRTCRDRLQGWPVPHSLERIDTSLGATTVLTAGISTGRPPVVMLPGAGLNAAMSLATVCTLRTKHRILIPDLPGEPGLSSSRRPHHHLPEAYGSWLDELLPQLCAEPVVVLGHSLGAAIALASTPDKTRVAGLVLVNPAGIVPIKRTLEVTRLRTKWLLDPSFEHSEQLLSYLMAPGFLPDMSLVSWYSMISEHCFPGRLPSALPARTIRRWAGQVPIVVATGEHDRLIHPDRLRGPARSLLGVDMHTIARCGHLALRDAADAVAELISSLPPLQKDTE